MLYDRPYMRADYEGNSPGGSAHPMLTRLLIANVAIFVCQHVFINLFGSNWINDLLALSFDNLAELKVWTFISYGFLHDTRGFIHILFNMLGLFFIGRILEPMLGSRSFVVFYFIALLVGGLIWLLSSIINGTYAYGFNLMGASAAVMALLVYFCLLFPERSITVLLFFIIPVTLKPKWILWFLLLTEGLGFLKELAGQGTLFGVAHSAHMGGVLAAFLLYRISVQAAPSFGYDDDSGGISIEPPRWIKNRKLRNVSNTKVKVNVTTRQAMEEEVNRILDKINKDGFGALTLDEKETLDKARDFLKR